MIKKEEILYDLSPLRALSNSGDAFVEKMVKMFCELVPPMIREMEDAYDAGDLNEMAAIAHKIKPSIDHLNIVSLKQIIRDLEQPYQQNMANNAIKEMFKSINSIMDDVIDKMKSEFPGAKNKE